MRSRFSFVSQPFSARNPGAALYSDLSAGRFTIRPPFDLVIYFVGLIAWR